MGTAAFRRLLAAPGTRWSVLAVVFVWGVFQSTWHLADVNVQTDEPAYQQAGLGYVTGDHTGNLQHPPTAKWLMGLAQLALGDGVESARVPVAVLSVLAGVVVFVWLRRDVGWYTGVLAAGMWWLLPRGITGDPSRIDRLALLDGPMVAFSVAGLWCAWRWAADDDRRVRWPWVLAAGVLMALAVTSKEAAAVLLPVVVLLPVLFRRWWGLLHGGVVFAAAFTATFVLVYLPFGAVRTVRYMIAFQGAHDAGGHSVVVAGHVYQFPPWWANLWFERAGTGGLVTVLLVAGVVAAVLVRPGRLVLVLGLATALYLVFFLVVADVALGEYYVAWMPFLTMLAAVGVSRLGTLRPVWLGRLLAAVLVAGLVVAAVRFTDTTAHLRREGIGRVQGVLDAQGRPHTRILSLGFAPSGVSAAFGDRVSIHADTGPFGAVVVGADPRWPVDPAAAAFLRDHADEFREFHLDDTTLWLPDGRVVQQPDGTLAVEPSSR